MIATLPDDVPFPALRRAQKLPALRDSVALALARNPQSEYRACLAEGLRSSQPRVVKQAAGALAKLEPRATSPEIAAAIGAKRYAPWFEWFTGLSGKQADLRDDEAAVWAGPM